MGWDRLGKKGATEMCKLWLYGIPCQTSLSVWRGVPLQFMATSIAKNHRFNHCFFLKATRQDWLNKGLSTEMIPEMSWLGKQGGAENPKAKRQQTNLSNTDNWFISFSPLASFFLEDEHYGRMHCKFHFSPPARWGLLDFIRVVLLG